jgi:hypothetical protein
MNPDPEFSGTVSILSKVASEFSGTVLSLFKVAPEFSRAVLSLPKVATEFSGAYVNQYFSLKTGKFEEIRVYMA